MSESSTPVVSNFSSAPTMDVVVIDDAQINLTLMQFLVKKIDGCNPICFEDPKAALSWCLSNQYDLIIIDYMMPELDGLEFIRRLRTKVGREEIPVLMVTAANEKDILYRALEIGATDFLTKPVDRNEFFSRVKNMLALRRSYLLLSDRAKSLAAEVKKATEDILNREKETVFRLVRAAEMRDPETGEHLLRMSNYSCLIAKRLGWDEKSLETILRAAPMHDVGKLGTPDSILRKPGKLTPEEFETMKEHAVIGWEILKDSNSPILQMGAEIALGHHEKFDGTGYPHGLAGEEIPLTCRIVAVADVFDALTSERPYKVAWEVDRAADYLKQNAGKHFDPHCVEVFFQGFTEVLDIRSRYSD